MELLCILLYSMIKILLLCVIYFFAWMPFPLLYVCSDLLFVVVYYIIGYRKKIVWENIAKAFPDLNAAEVKTIQKKFYKDFCDNCFELIKLKTISASELNKRMIGNWEVFHNILQEGKTCYALLGHRFNWEWANAACGLNSLQPFYGIYLPLSNKNSDEILKSMRTRMGSHMVAATHIIKLFKSIHKEPSIVGFIADQSPGNLRDAIWVNFLNRPAPFMCGPEKAARTARACVVYAQITKIKRGYYQVHLQQITEDASIMPPNWITLQYVKFLTAEIYQQPSNWLWSHRRWKHAPPTDVSILNAN